MAIRYDFPGIIGKLSEIDKLAKELEGILEDIDTDVKKLAEQWQGQGKDGWHEVQTKWQNVAQGDTAALNRLVSTGHSAVEDMKAAARSAKAQFAQ
jgi:WXG100 family type VII secretion target